MLKLFCPKVGIIGKRNKRKYNVAAAIVKTKPDTVFAQLKNRVAVDNSTSSGNEKEQKTSTCVIINRCRFLNVLFMVMLSIHIQLLLALHCLKKIWTLVKKRYKIFHELVEREYNKPGIQTYGNNSWPHLTTGRTLSPSKYQDSDWKKSRETFRFIINEYNQAFKN